MHSETTMTEPKEIKAIRTLYFYLYTLYVFCQFCFVLLLSDRGIINQDELHTNTLYKNPIKNPDIINCCISGSTCSLHQKLQNVHCTRQLLHKIANTLLQKNVQIILRTQSMKCVCSQPIVHIMF